MDPRCTPTRFSHIPTKLHCQLVAARTLKLPNRPQQNALRIWHRNSSSNAVANFGFPSPWPTSGFRCRGQLLFAVADGINGERQRGGPPSIKLLATFRSNAVVDVGFQSPSSVCGGDGINGGRERGNSPSIEFLETSSSNAVVNFGFPSPNSGCGGDGIKGGGGGDGGGGGEGGGGDGGGGGGEGGGEEEERFEGEKPMIGSPEIGRWLESRGKYRTAADESGETPHISGGSGREPGEIPFPYILDCSGSDPDESLFSGGLGRLMADEFFAKPLIEYCGDDGLFPKNAAEYQKYKDKMLKELEIAAADVMRFRADSMMKPVQIGETHPGDPHGEEF